MTNFPSNCIKGIPHKELCTGKSGVLGELFVFDESRDLRPDGWVPSSINWEDDGNAISFTLKQRRNGSIRYKAGVALIPTAELRRLKRSPAMGYGTFSFERNKSNGNDYHGNLLMAEGTEKRIKVMLRSGLALNATRIPQLEMTE